VARRFADASYAAHRSLGRSVRHHHLGGGGSSCPD
jgi:hypothetical protein